MNKNGLVDVVRTTSIVYERRGAILQRMSIRMLFFLLVSFVEHGTYRSGKSPGSVYDAMDSIFTSPG